MNDDERASFIVILHLGFRRTLEHQDGVREIIGYRRIVEGSNSGSVYVSGASQFPKILILPQIDLCQRVRTVGQEV